PGRPAAARADQESPRDPPAPHHPLRPPRLVRLLADTTHGRVGASRGRGGRLMLAEDASAPPPARRPKSPAPPALPPPALAISTWRRTTARPSRGCRAVSRSDTRRSTPPPDRRG